MSTKMEYLKTFFLIGLVSLSCTTANESCQIVDTEEKRCLSQGSITVECPLNYIVVIKSVTVEVGAVDICPTTAEDSSCVLSDYSDEVRGDCFFKKTCDLYLETPTDRSMCPISQFKATEYFARLVYRCEALHNAAPTASAMAICSDESFTGNNINIDSTELVFEGSEKISRTSCTCTVTIPPKTEVINSVLYLPPTESCDQRIEIIQGDTIYKICSREPSNLDLGCSEKQTELTLRFVNDDPNTQLGFIVRFYTSHLANITVTCGGGVETTSTSTISPTTTTTHTTKATTPTTTITTPTTTAKESTTIKLTTTTAPTTTTTPTTKPTTSTSTLSPTTSTTTSSSTSSTSSSRTSTTTFSTISTNMPAGTVEEGNSTDADDIQNSEKDGTTDSDSETHVGESTSKRLIWPIIVGVLGAGMFILIITCVIIGLRYRHDKERELYVEPSESDRGSQFTYVTGVYVEGNQQSKLVVKRPVKQMKTVLS